MSARCFAAFVAVLFSASAAVSPARAATVSGGEGQALANAAETRKIFASVKRFIEGWWELRDPDTALIPQNVKSRLWTPKNSAADLWPFMVIGARFVDRSFYDGECRRTLAAEQRLSNRVRRLPDDYDLEKDRFVHAKLNLDRVIFGASEYAKDGLIPVVELLGPSTPYFKRLRELEDDIIAVAPVETRFGRIPSNNVEVNGEMLQVLSRLWWATRDERYLDFGARIAQHYLLDKPLSRFERLRLRDHGGEIVNGLCEFYVAAKRGRPALAARLRGPLIANLDHILEVGRNSDGLFYNAVDAASGRVLDKGVADTWGYVMDGYYALWRDERIERYRDATRKALASLGRYFDYDWEHGNADGLADALESALTLLRWEPTKVGFDFCAHTCGKMLAVQKPSGIYEGWHGDGNVARSALMWAFFLSQGAYVEPWRGDLGVGAVRRGGRLVVCVSAERSWKGRLVFDRPRHKDYLRMEIDYPRINAFAEWFIAERGRKYRVAVGGSGGGRVVGGEELARGLPVEVSGGKPLFVYIEDVATAGGRTKPERN